MTNNDNDQIELAIDKMIKDTYDLLKDTIILTKETDNRAKIHNKNIFKRHRLHVLLESAENNKKTLSKNIIYNPWFLSELFATSHFVNKWKFNPIWKEIEPSLVDDNHFKHTILKLCVADSFTRVCHEIKILPRQDEKSPDLLLKTIDGIDSIYVECYQPNILCGKYIKITDNEIKKINKQVKNKIKGQLSGRTGIFFICGYNQPPENIYALRKFFEQEIKKYKYNICGIGILSLNCRITKNNDQMTIVPAIHTEFIRSPNYFGKINLITDEEDQINLSRLKLVDSLQPNRTIMEGNSPFFYGEGNVNYICGKCDNILAKQIWSSSVSNIIVICPNCKSLNEFPLIIPDINWYISYLIRGNYDIKKPIFSSMGICILGI